MGRVIAVFLSLVFSFYGETRAVAETITGTMSGIFQNPSPACSAPVVCSGVGSSSITWGDPLSGIANALSFNGASFSTVPDTPFGTVTYTNGSTVTGTSIDSISLVLATGATSSSIFTNLQLPLTIAIGRTQTEASIRLPTQTFSTFLITFSSAVSVFSKTPQPLCNFSASLDLWISWGSARSVTQVSDFLIPALRLFSPRQNPRVFCCLDLASRD